ncbi:LysR family transcriptional regulator [Marinobacterium nitratireducens]|uniref:LysR family transcriptional regulator n=1 Tax=Marinobacterium nitratireducens TaxID=518897 RepID=A0A918DNV2_9GAMM|nr:transcriptional regulator GcvA [Marinobacterium nitratireducens]GGO76017.1 LysR family transcriptional regulator [Marinobacterium nitratireducens]
MKYPLPPLNPLRTFEAAARLCSLTSAAEELNVSQVAVSRQVRVLEDYLGVALFRRLHRGIELTREGRELYEGITEAFQDISNAARKVSRRGRRDILSIQSYTTFSQRWLIPRLANFHDTNESIEVRLSSSVAPVDFETQNIDASIRSGHGDWPDLHAEKLVDIELIPICSPTLMESAKLNSPQDLSRVRLLHSMARPNDWANWVSSAGANIDADAGIRFDNSALAYEAASMNIGVAIAVKVFVERQIQNGSFIAPFDTTCKTGEGYYLTWPRNMRPSEPLLKFLSWMRELLSKTE